MGESSTSPDAPLPTVFDSRYQVEGMLGRGGMATVYVVHDSQTNERLALKALRSSGDDSRDQRAQQLFEREYHTLVQLAHPHIVRVHDYGLCRGLPYYTMEVLDGGDLKDHTGCDWQTACRMARDVCSALSLMHSRRLVYRDLGPRNVRWTEDGHAKLIDFGALVEMGGPQPAVCTPPVAAPEDAILPSNTIVASSSDNSLSSSGAPWSWAESFAPTIHLIPTQLLSGTTALRAKRLFPEAVGTRQWKKCAGASLSTRRSPP